MSELAVFGVCFALACIPAYLNYRARKALLDDVLRPLDAPLRALRDRDGYFVRADGVRFADPDGRLIVKLPKSWRSPRNGASE